MSSNLPGRREKRKALKKVKRKQWRQQNAELERLEEEARLQDPEEQLRISQQLKLDEEREELEREKHEKEERMWLLREQQVQDEFQRKMKEQALKSPRKDDGEYEDGAPELIWEGNEITVIKHKVKVKTEKKEEKDRPFCNPPPPRSFISMLNQSRQTDGADANRNYGTEQDKTHCPFHIKTGVCRFGTRCCRVHVYPEKSCTLLIKNMYTGPGLAREHDEGLEYTDEEVAEQFEEFYEDVHSEFLKFGELVNFKVCRNSSPHLRGNVYVHYQSEDSAVSACFSLCGRYYANKQIIPEFVGVTKWKVALCGDYMKPHQGNCSRGSACNFLHCFCNPGGEYDWADRDSRPPRSWKQKMASLFGYTLDHDDELSHRSHHHRTRDRERSVDDHRDRRSHSVSSSRKRKRDDRDDHSSSDRDRRSRHSSRRKGKRQHNKSEREHDDSDHSSSDRDRRRNSSSSRRKGKRQHRPENSSSAYDRWQGGN